MTAQLAPTPVFRGVDAFGFPLYLGQLGTFVAGTNTPQVTYKDSLGIATNTNPVILNPRGECNLWLDPAKAYKLVLSDQFGNLIWTVDNVTIGNANPSYSIVPTVDNLFTLGSPTFSFANLYLGANHAPVLDTVSGNVGYYARTSAEIAAAVTPTSFFYAVDPEYNIKRYGAALGNTNAQNKTALTTAIAVAQASSGAAAKNGVYILIPPDCHYGYKFTDITTYPQINSGTVPITVVDYSQGDTYDNYPTIYDGMQLRYFFYTPPTTIQGNHNGNGIVHGGAWHPYYQISNNSGVTYPSTTALDNRRASLEFAADGLPMWRWGQGTQQGVAFAPFQLVNLTLQQFNNISQAITMTGNPLVGATSATLTAAWLGQNDIVAGQFQNAGNDIRDVHLTNGSTTVTWTQGLSGNTTGPSLTLAPVNPTTGGNAMIVQYGTQNFYFNTGANLSDSNYHFKAPVSGFINGTFESLTDTCELRLRNSAGSGQDVALRNEAGALAFWSNTTGDMIRFPLATGQILCQTGLVERRNAIAYSVSMTPNCTFYNYFTIAATNGVAFTINAPTNPVDGERITIEISNTSGGALGAITWNAVFKLNAFPSPSNGNSTAIDFRYNGTNWRQAGTPVAVAN